MIFCHHRESKAQAGSLALVGGNPTGWAPPWTEKEAGVRSEGLAVRKHEGPRLECRAGAIP